MSGLAVALAACGAGTPTSTGPLRLAVFADDDRCTAVSTVVRSGPALLQVQNDGAGPLVLVVTRATDGAELGRAAGVLPGELAELLVEVDTGETLLSCSRAGRSLAGPVRFRAAS